MTSPKRVFVSYSSPEQDADARKLETNLGKAKFDVWSDYTTPAGFEQDEDNWREEAIGGADSVLVIMSNSYQAKDRCKLEADLASNLKAKYGKPAIGFLKVENFVENEWLKSVKGKARTIDLTGRNYDKNLNILTNIVKRLPTAQATGKCNSF